MSAHSIPFFNIKTKSILNYAKSATMEFAPRNPRKEFETAVVNELSVFEPLKCYCKKRYTVRKLRDSLNLYSDRTGKNIRNYFCNTQ